MLDKIEVRVPYYAGFRPEFRFLKSELKYAGFGSPVRKSQHYAGVCDLTSFGLDAIVHVNLKRNDHRNHKLELLRTGRKSLAQMAGIIDKVFAIDPHDLDTMRLDFAADLDDIPVSHLHGSLRVKFKRITDGIGKTEYEIVGGKQLQYVRFGKAPNCLRFYDKQAECMARFPKLLKRSNPDAEPPSFEDLFGFPPTAVRTRVERQAGSTGIPDELSKFGQLYDAAEYNPFAQLELVPNSFPFPDPKQCGVANSLKLAGLRCFIQKFGFQQARAALNIDRNAKRLFDDYQDYLKASEVTTKLTVEDIVKAYRSSTTRQIDGSIEYPQMPPKAVEQTSAGDSKHSEANAPEHFNSSAAAVRMESL